MWCGVRCYASHAQMPLHSQPPLDPLSPITTCTTDPSSVSQSPTYVPLLGTLIPCPTVPAPVSTGSARATYLHRYTQLHGFPIHPCLAQGAIEEGRRPVGCPILAMPRAPHAGFLYTGQWPMAMEELLGTVQQSAALAKPCRELGHLQTAEPHCHHDCHR